MNEETGLTLAKECEEIIMKGLTGERKRWPVLINRRRDTPKSPIHKLTMEFSTKQNLEWNMGGVNADRVKKMQKEKTDSSPFSPFTCLSYCSSVLEHQPQACGPIVHISFSETVFSKSHWSVL